MEEKLLDDDVWNQVIVNMIESAAGQEVTREATIIFLSPSIKGKKM